MRRWLILFLLALLPLQFSWAAAAGYCQHETLPSEAAHFGHHQHEHHESSAPAEPDDAEKSSFAVDNDCAFCHLGGAQMLMSPVPAEPEIRSPLQVGLQPSLHGSHIPDTPERPDRHIA